MSSPLRIQVGDPPPDEGDHGDPRDARAWWTVAVVVALVLVVYLGVSAGMVGSRDANAPQPAPVPPPPAASAPEQPSPAGLDDLGALPGLLDDFSTPDCDFDDALSTCQ